MTTARSNIANFPDVIYYVVSHLDPWVPDGDLDVYTVRRALARSARTCRNFTRPALKMLWKHLPDDQPLADLLCTLGIARRHGAPNSAVGSGATKLARFEVPIQLHPGLWFSASERDAVEQRWKSFRGYDDRYTLCDSGDPSTHVHWKPFEEYASHVRAITLFALDGPKWCELWQELVPRLSGRPLLPHLQSMSLKAISPLVLTDGAFFLMTRSVTTLNFAFKHDGHRVHSTLHRAFDHAPTIENLRLSVGPWDSMHDHCHSIRRVSIVPQVDPRQLQYIVKFADLRSLSVSLSDTFVLTDELPLPSLETLDVKGDWPCLADLFTFTRAPNLRTLILEAWEPGTTAQQVAQYATECIHAISTNHTSLTSLTVHASYGCTPLVGGCVARSIPIVEDTFEGSLLDIARPLLALHDLRTLTLSLPDYLDLDCSSEDLRAMSEAWRDLEALHVEFWEYFAPMGMERPGGDRPRGGPLAALHHFARNCPRLRTLHLPPMDATQLKMGADLSEGDFPAHELERLIVSKLNIGAQDDLAQEIDLVVVQFVERIFPKAAWAFRKERVGVADGWAVAHENAHCIDCRDLRMPTGTF
ncbi:hypothetical protein V8D89_005256 [Ganoderma adspersum]